MLYENEQGQHVYSFDGGGGFSAFLVKTLEQVIRLHAVLNFFVESSFKDIGFFAIDSQVQGQQFPKGDD